MPSISCLFLSKFKKFNNTGARMLDSLDHMTFKLLNITFWGENVKIVPAFAQRYLISLRYTTNL